MSDGRKNSKCRPNSSPATAATRKMIARAIVKVHGAQMQRETKRMKRNLQRVTETQEKWMKGTWKAIPAVSQSLQKLAMRFRERMYKIKTW